ncbi:MAG: methylmalonyl-CoA mutase family protein [Cytophagales bacterium]|nr:methylmalonyl-CoA mutase family protein [Cytophagales bacterium]
MKKGEEKFTQFTATRLRDWEQAATEELQGADPWKKLALEKQGLLLKPFYTPENTSTAPFLLPVSKNHFLGPRAWHNCPLVTVTDVKIANETALRHLQNGADGIYFELAGSPDFEILLQGIEWPHCALNFLAKENEDHVASGLASFLQKKYNGKGPTVGAFFGSHPVRPHQPGFHFAGYSMSAAETPAVQITHAFLAVINSLKADFPKRSAEVAFSVEIGTDFFLEVVKLRAVRILWEKLVTLQKGKTGTPVFLHARSHSWNEPAFSPHGNMLKGTTAAMAAILGGCDVLTVDAEQENDDTLSRVARNVSSILREESHFSKVADPLGGSYFIESLTEQLVTETWKALRKELNA